MHAKEGWEVAWCAEIPVDEHGESLFDCADFRFRDFKSERAARAWVPTAQALDVHGEARLVHWREDRYGGRDILHREVI